jgi:hypothetical protein
MGDGMQGPSTLKRCRPLGVRTTMRLKHHNHPRKAPKTKWAASTKKTARSPALACSRRGSSSFF